MASLTYVSRYEWIIAGIIAIAVSLIALSPYLYGYFSAPPTDYYIGGHFINFHDLYTYLAWIEQAKQGNFFSATLFSLEGEGKTYFHPLFYILGLIANVIDCPSIVVYHGARFILNMALFLLAYYFIAKFFIDKNHRLVCYILLLTSSGVGYLVGGNSLDLWIVESNIFFNALESTINIFALSLLLLSIIVFTELQTHFSKIKLIGLMLTLNLLIISHPYEVVLLIALIISLTIFQIWQQRSQSKYHIILLLTTLVSLSPGVFFIFTMLRTTPVLNIWATFQTNAPAFPFVDYLSGYGVSLIFAFAGLILIIQKKYQHFVLPFLWLIIQIFLIFNPISDRYQRKLGLGIQLPMVILATYGLFNWLKELELSGLIKKFILISMILLWSLNSWYLIERDIAYLRVRGFPLFVSNNLKEGIQQYGKLSTDEDKLLTGSISGYLIPGLVGRKVYFGHSDQTVNYEMKAQVAKLVLTSSINASDPLLYFLKQEKIDYIFADDQIKAWGGLITTDRPYLKLVFENTNVQIYEVLEN